MTRMYRLLDILIRPSCSTIEPAQERVYNISPWFLYILPSFCKAGKQYTEMVTIILQKERRIVTKTVAVWVQTGLFYTNVAHSLTEQIWIGM